MTDPSATDPAPTDAVPAEPSPAEPMVAEPAPALDPTGAPAPALVAPAQVAPGSAPAGYGAPGYAPPGYGPAAPPAGYGPPYGAPAPAPRRAPGFAGVPARDYVTDGVAALALLVSLALPWNAAQAATDRIEVVLLTVLSLLALSVHYLYRSGVFPATWSARTVALVRALVTAPYVVMVAVTLLLDVVSGFGRGSGMTPSLGITPGLGSAAVLGLAGAVLAGLPRRAELDAHAAAVLLGRLRPTFLVLAIVAGVVQVAGLASFVALRGLSIWIVVQLVVRALGLAVLVGGLLLAVARARDAWRPVLLVAGAVLAIWSVLVTRYAWYSVSGVDLAIALLPAAAALATAPVPWGTDPDRRRSGVATAVAALQSIALIGALWAVLMLLTVVGGWEYVTKGPLITVFVLELFITVAAVVGASALRQGPPTSRTAAWVAVGVIVLLGLIVLVVPAASDTPAGSWPGGLVALGLPALVVWALALPGSGRTAQNIFSTTGAPPPARPAWAQQPAPHPYPPAPGYPAPAYPAPPAPAPAYPAPPAHGFVPAQAADPRTDLAVLARITAEAPELRPYVAANPAAYPALLDWLASLHDPAIDAALASRPPR